VFEVLELCFLLMGVVSSECFKGVRQRECLIPDPVVRQMEYECEM